MRNDETVAVTSDVIPSARDFVARVFNPCWLKKHGLKTRATSNRSILSTCEVEPASIDRVNIL